MKESTKPKPKLVKGAETEEAKEGPSEKPRFRVGLAYRRVKVFTVRADTAQEACEIVLDGRGGRDGGFEGDPVLSDAAAMPFDQPGKIGDLLTERMQVAFQALDLVQRGGPPAGGNVLQPGPAPGEKMTQGGIILP